MESNNILRQYGKLVQGNRYDFAITFGKKTRWQVPQNVIGNFFLDYCTQLKSNMIEGRGRETIDELDETIPRAVFGIAQKPSQFVPFVIDLNLKFATPPGEPYDTHFVRKVVKCIQSALNDHYEITREEGDHLICVVTEWENPAIVSDRRPGCDSAQLYKIRFHFPYCRVSGDTITKVVPKITTYLRKVNALGDLEQTPIGDWEQLLKPFVNEPIPLYGSSEKTEYPMLILTDIYDDLIDDDLDGENTVEPISVDDIFDIENHSLVQTGIIKSTLFEHLNNDDLLPLYLSTNYIATSVSVREIEATPSFEITDDIPQEFGRFLSNIHQEKTNAEIAVELLSLVSAHRFIRRMTWIDIGKALYHSCDGDEEGLYLWIQQTERAIANLKTQPEYLQGMTVHDKCREEYEAFESDGVTTVKTIAWFAREDSPGNYKKWHNQWAMAYREAALDLTDHSIAKALYRDVWLKFCCGSISRKEYYEFRNHRWVKIDGGYSIRKFISTEFKRSFEELRLTLLTQAAQSNDINYKNRVEDTAKLLSSLIGKLGMVSKKANIMKEITDEIFIERFDAVVDKNGNITGLPNGVTEVDYDHRLINFRPGKPEDYITHTTSARFCPDMTWNHPKVVELMDYFEKFQPDPETRHFFLKLLGSGFKAGNLDKKLPVLSGDKNNSKSTVVKLITKTWGSYAVKFPTTGLTRGYSDSGAANPAWARLAGPRFAFADEPDEKEKFRTGPVKLISGNDDFYARQLFKDGGDLEPTATVITACNRIPPFENADDASKERFVVIPCSSTWLPANRAPETLEQQMHDRIFPMDKDFINRVRLLGTALLWVSYQYFPIWAEEGLEYVPPEIKAATDAYWAENDVYLMYTSDRVEECEDGSAGLTVTELYQDFEVWFNKYNRGKEVPDRATFRYHIGARWESKPTNNTWWGIKFRAVETDGVSENSLAATNTRKKGVEEPKKRDHIPTPPKQLKNTLGLPSISEIPLEQLKNTLLGKDIPLVNGNELMTLRVKPEQKKNTNFGKEEPEKLELMTLVQ